MIRKYRFEILAAIAIVIFGALFLYTSSKMAGGDFAGTDARGALEVSKITGIPAGGFRPLVAQWIPPGSEVESALFALQASVGGICVGWIFGYWKGLKDREKEKEGGKG